MGCLSKASYQMHSVHNNAYTDGKKEKQKSHITGALPVSAALVSASDLSPRILAKLLLSNISLHVRCPR